MYVHNIIIRTATFTGKERDFVVFLIAANSGLEIKKRICPGQPEAIRRMDHASHQQSVFYIAYQKNQSSILYLNIYSALRIITYKVPVGDV